MTLNRQELATGAIFIAIGLFFGISTLIDLDIGTARRMGPGFFPIAVSAALIVTGLVVMAKGFKAGIVVERPVPWRGIATLIAAPVLFGATIRGLGLIPTVFLVVFMVTFASRKGTIKLALVLATCLTIFCVLVFNMALGLPLRLFGTWLEPLARIFA